MQSLKVFKKGTTPECLYFRMIAWAAEMENEHGGDKTLIATLLRLYLTSGFEISGALFSNEQ